MAPFYGWDSISSRPQSRYEETVYFLPLSPSGILGTQLINHGWMKG